jgi:hypothetical protein
MFFTKFRLRQQTYPSWVSCYQRNQGKSDLLDSPWCSRWAGKNTHRCSHLQQRRSPISRMIKSNRASSSLPIDWTTSLSLEALPQPAPSRTISICRKPREPGHTVMRKSQWINGMSMWTTSLGYHREKPRVASESNAHCYTVWISLFGAWMTLMDHIDKGDATWVTRKTVLGWILDTVKKPSNFLHIGLNGFTPSWPASLAPSAAPPPRSGSKS